MSGLRPAASRRRTRRHSGEYGLGADELETTTDRLAGCTSPYGQKLKEKKSVRVSGKSDTGGDHSVSQPSPPSATDSQGQPIALLPNDPAEDRGIWMPPWKRMNDPRPVKEEELAILDRVPIKAPVCCGFQVVNGYWTDPNRTEEARRASIRIEQLKGVFFRNLRPILKYDGKWP